jgi:hypothetical protein
LTVGGIPPSEEQSQIAEKRKLAVLIGGLGSGGELAAKHTSACLDREQEAGTDRIQRV